ncbi:MAG TPA: hypothetical protein VJ890_24395 [Vineibacter sp.]|nr:hypothetical protein [Vineibacter sp.]
MSSEWNYNNPAVARFLIGIGVGGPVVLLTFMVFRVELFWFAFLLWVSTGLALIVALFTGALLPFLRSGSIPTGPNSAIARSTRPVRYWLMIFLYLFLAVCCAGYLAVWLFAAYSRVL